MVRASLCTKIAMTLFWKFYRAHQKQRYRGLIHWIPKTKFGRINDRKAANAQGKLGLIQLAKVSGAHTGLRRWTYQNPLGCENGFFCWFRLFLLIVLMRWDYPWRNFWTCMSVRQVSTEEEVHSTGQTISDFYFLPLPQYFLQKTFAVAHRYCAIRAGIVWINGLCNSTSRNARLAATTVWELVAKMVLKPSDPIPKPVHLCGNEQASKDRC